MCKGLLVKWCGEGGEGGEGGRPLSVRRRWWLYCASPKAPSGEAGKRASGEAGKWVVHAPFFSSGVEVAGMASSFSLTASRNASCCIREVTIATTCVAVDGGRGRSQVTRVVDSGRPSGDR